MSRLAERMKRIKKSGGKALVLFATAGDPSLAVTRQLLWYCQEAGVDCLELGIPFSDPLADGPVIQASSYRAVGRGVSLTDVIRLVAEERRKGLELPVAFMSSINPLHAMGFGACASAMKKAGVDGVIIPDWPYTKNDKVRAEFAKAGISTVQLTSPTTPKERVKKILGSTQGFLYYVSLVGLTGKTKRKSYDFLSDVRALKKSSKHPVLVGFGVTEPADAKKIKAHSDGVIVGTALVNELNAHSQKSLSTHSKRFIDAFVKAAKS